MGFEIRFLGVRGSLQGDDGSNTSLLLASEKTSVLIDCSGNLGFAVDADISDLIITHEHVDHLYGFPSLIHQMWLSGRREPLCVHAHKEVLSLVNKMIDAFSFCSKKGMFEIRLVEMGCFFAEDVHIVPFASNHTSCSFGLQMKCFNHMVVYTSDTGPMMDIDIQEPPDVLITEASGLSRDEELLVSKGHQSALDAGRLAMRLKAKRLYMVHLPTSSDECSAIEAEAREVFPPAAAAQSLETIALE